MEEVKITTDYIRLDSLLKFVSAAGSGGEAKILIQNGEISVNGEICAVRGKKLRPGDIVSVSGKNSKKYLILKDEKT